MASERRKRRNKAEWAELVLQYEASGGEAEAFARARGLNPRTLLWWQSQLKVGSSYRRRSEPKRRRSRAPASSVSKATVRSVEVLTARLVDKLVVEPGQTTAVLATELRFAPAVVRSELKELEDLGIVFRRGHGPGTRWFPG